MGNMQKFLSILDHGRVRGRINQIGT
jgi:hypothetical protein